MNSPVKNIISTLHDHGLVATLLPDDRVSVAPIDRLNDELRALIRSHKTEIIRELEVANDQTITVGTRRPPGLSPKLLEASLAFDRRLVESGYTLTVPPDRPMPQPPVIVAVPKDNPPPRKKKLDHFHVNAPWRVLSKAYYQHHFNCQQCICAGRGARYGKRCDIGAALWTQYAEREFKTGGNALSWRASP